MKILVTGGSGFIGSNLVQMLLQNTTDSVVNLDLLTYAAHPLNLAGVQNHPRYVFVRGNICDRDLLTKIVKDHGIEAIIHTAAESHVDRSIHDATAFIQTNVLGTQTLLDVARKNGVKKFVHVSTDEVYGSLSPSDPAFTETTPLHPNSPYSASKAASDFLALAAYHTHGFPVVITRCSNNYGPRQFPEKLIPLVILRAQAGQSIPVYGNGLNVRDWIFVNDHCRGIVAALQQGQPGEVYNFGGASELNNLAVVKTILKLLQKGEDLITYVKDRPGHDWRYAIDFQKAKSELGWQPAVNFTDGIRQTLDWYASHGEWVKLAQSESFQDYYQKQYGVL